MQDPRFGQRERGAVTVQVVERHALTREGLVALINAAPGLAAVFPDSDIDRAVEFAIATHPDVVLMEFRVPGRKMFSAIQILGRRSPVTRIVLLDDQFRELHTRLARRAGAVGYVTKESSFARIDEVLRRVAAGEMIFPERSESPAVEYGRRDQHDIVGPVARLSPREIDVLVHLSEGYSVAQCAELLGLSPSTIDNHKSRLMKKLHVNRAESLAAIARDAGLVPA